MADSSSGAAAARLTAGRFVRRGLRFHFRSHLAVALGVAAATAVVTGALLVGDSMRGSLRALTHERLGRIDYAVTPNQFFSASVAERLRAGEAEGAEHVAGVIRFARAAVETAGAERQVRRAGSVQVIAADEAFWELDDAGMRPDVLPSGYEVVLNRPLAEELGVAVGDEVTVRLPLEQAVPADSPLGRRESESEGLPRLEVIAIVPDAGLARFSLTPSQQQPMTAFLPLELVQDALDRDGQINTLLAASSEDGADELETAARAASQWSDRLPLELADYGLRLERVRRTFPDSDDEADEEDAAPRVVFDYFALTSDRLMLPSAAVEAIRRRLGDERVEPVMTYLANAIERIDEDGNVVATVPYSTLSAVRSGTTFPIAEDLDPGAARRFVGGAEESERQAADGDAAPVPLVLNRWAAEQLGAAEGDRLRVAYFEPETAAGREVERFFAARVAGVVPITEPATPYRGRRAATFDEPPTLYNDPALTPEVPGVTDQRSISDWDLPFELTREISSADDEYWNQYRLTPKAFIPLADGRRLFGSRFGDTTNLRIPPSMDEAALEAELLAALDSVRPALGFAVVPLRAQQLGASRGTTPFDALFLSLSFFVIVAALMLVALLYRLGLEQRASEYGTLLAVGLPGRRVAQLALAEGAATAVLGAAFGVAAGVAYAAAVLEALRSWWVGAVTVPFLEFHWTVTSLLVGATAGVVMASATLWWTARRLRRADVRSLLAGRMSDGGRVGNATRPRRWPTIAALVCVVGAFGLGATALGLGGQAQAGAFVGGGMLLLVGVLMLVYGRLDRWQASERRRALARSYSLATMAGRAAARNPLRSTLSIGLLAVACFLIVSMSAFQMRPTDEGVGGFNLLAQSAQPLYRDMSDPDVRRDLLGGDAEALADATVFGLRLRPGQDASCNNLYQAAQPQVLGVPEQMAAALGGGAAEEAGAAGGDAAGAEDGPLGFAWAAGSEEGGSPWAALATPAEGTAADPIPMVLDQNTALWSLQMRGGVGEVRPFPFDDGRERYFRVVGLLSNTVLQGGLLIGEENFERAFPEISGYQFFLIRTPPAAESRAEAVLENRLGDIGMDAVRSREVLARLLAVQNTYLRTFQALGALGLLLGTFGLATVQMRNVLERRGELALMRAVGFGQRRLARLVMLENLMLLFAGIGCGVAVALSAVLPYMIAGRARLGLGEPLVMLLVVAVVGSLAGIAAVRRVLKMPLLASLRAN